MNITITTTPPVVPQERVVLDLSVEEFTMLDTLRYHYLAGCTVLRNDIESGFLKVREGLSPGNRELVKLALRTACGSAEVSDLFRS